jgi:hypothetical protein
MYREIITPKSEEISLTIPAEYLHKRIEVTFFEVDEGIDNDKMSTLQTLFDQAKNIRIDSSVNIDSLMNEINHDLF